MRKVIASLAIAGCLSNPSFAQTTQVPPATRSAQPAQPAESAPAETYPRVKAYLSFIIPWVTINKNTTTTEFQAATTVGFPVGINVYFRESFGFSYEITPLIVWQNVNGKATSKMTSLVFDPGPIFRYSHGINFVPRLAFETSGRFGVTPVLNKVYARTKDADYWFSISAPARFGSNLPASIGANLQIGFTFN